MLARRLRKRSRKRRKARSIGDPPSFFLPMAWDSFAKGQAKVRSRRVSLPNLRQVKHDMPGLVILSKIAHSRPVFLRPDTAIGHDLPI